jgi:hypothetical protein
MELATIPQNSSAMSTEGTSSSAVIVTVTEAGGNDDGKQIGQKAPKTGTKVSFSQKTRILSIFSVIFVLFKSNSSPKKILKFMSLFKLSEAKESSFRFENW